MANILYVRETDSAVIAMPRVMRFDLLDSDGNPTGVPADAFERVRA